MTITPSQVSIGNLYSRQTLANLFEEQNIATSREGWYMREGNDYVPFFVTLDKTKADPRVAYNDFFEDGVFHWESQNQIAINSPRILKVIEGQVTSILFLLIHEAQQGCRDATYEPSRFPVAVPYPSPHRATPAYVVVTSSDLDTSRNKASVSGLSWISRILFVREVAKIKNKTQAFIYAGRLTNPIVDRTTSNPVKFVFEPADLDGSEGEPLRSLIEWKPSGARRATASSEIQRVIEKRKAARASSGQGRESDPKVRKAIELHAMERARRLYERDNFVVKDVSANRPYDLQCDRPGMKARKVEVKGTRGDGQTVFLTANEVESARDVSEPTDLVVVSGIELAEKDGEPVASGGELKVYRRWVPLDDDLKAIEYRYSVPVDATE